jgi:UDP-glucose 4-epimerase
VKALLTGSAGFIGKHVAQALAAAGYAVTGIDLAEGHDCRRLLPGLVDSYDVAVHCAAAVVSPAAKAGSQAVLAANLEIDAAFFGWAAQARPGRVVYFSSSCAYPLGLPAAPFSESQIALRSPLWPDGLYGWAKLTGEHLASALADDGIPATVIRPFSVYGPGMADGFAVRSFIRQAQAGPRIEIWGTGTQQRDYVHVTDVAATVTAAIAESVDGPVNAGTGRATTLTELVRMIRPDADIILVPGKPEGPAYLVADATRLATFRPPQITLEDGLKGVPE